MIQRGRWYAPHRKWKYFRWYDLFIVVIPLFGILMLDERLYRRWHDEDWRLQ